MASTQVAPMSHNTDTETKQALICPYCERVSASPQGHAAHVRFCQANPNRLTGLPARRSKGHGMTTRAIRTKADVDRLADVVASVFPTGIPTDDHQRLAGDLAFIIEDLGQRVSR